ncbi:threonine/serine exporter ThrE family protein [Methanothermobacter sp. K4]|uniref:threonine/serine ThrE exporter family protein n=1 Tax=Methanothermobacter sp. K4 TaxID=2913262 RepID=UPI001EDB8B50|nr:threonine/serine exporter family protein [Methanothermobacter sp. K4]MCG2828734.1 threonine/serine exporter family protein [Methanothermobacter sp. K4]
MTDKLVEFLEELSRALIASGNSVSETERILRGVAESQDVKVEVSVLPTMLIIKAGGETSRMSLAAQSPGVMPLHQVTKIYRLIDDVRSGGTEISGALAELREIVGGRHRFGRCGMFLGYLILSVGIAFLIQPDLNLVVYSSLLSLISGALIVLGYGNRRLSLIMPVLASFTISGVAFFLIRAGAVTGNLTLIVPPLIYFIPGVTLTTGIYELASGELVSGSSRVIYGCMLLLLLVFGVLMGMQINGFPQEEFAAIKISTLSYSPYIGAVLFAAGIYLFLSVYRSDFPWILLVLYTALVGQQVGNTIGGGLLGAFLGALSMTMMARAIEMAGKTPHFVTLYPAFWFLAPGSIGFIGLANLLGKNYLTSIAEITLFAMTVIAIALGLLVGALLTEPLHGKIRAPSGD